MMGGRFLISGAQIGVIKALLTNGYDGIDEDSGFKELFDFIHEIEENGFIGQSFTPLKTDIMALGEVLSKRKLVGATKV